MNLSNINKVFSHRIVSGAEYHWDCYGPNTRYLDFESEYAHGSALYDTVTLEVYEANVNDKADNYRYRWLNPQTVDSYIDECKAKGIDYKNAWDSCEWVDLDLEEDFLEKARAVFEGKPFDNRIQVPLELEDDVFLELAKQAHSRDITINKMVELVLQHAIDEHKSKKETS